MSDPLIADPVAALVAVLLADTVTNSLASGRVFGGELPEEETPLMPRLALVLRASGGVAMLAGSYVRADTMRIDAYAYGPTPRAAAGLMSVAALALRGVERLTIAHTLIHWVRPAGGYSSGREPDVEWPRAWQSFQVLHALNPVA